MKSGKFRRELAGTPANIDVKAPICRREPLTGQRKEIKPTKCEKYPQSDELLLILVAAKMGGGPISSHPNATCPLMPSDDCGSAFRECVNRLWITRVEHVKFK